MKKKKKKNSSPLKKWKCDGILLLQCQKSFPINYANSISPSQTTGPPCQDFHRCVHSKFGCTLDCHGKTFASDKTTHTTLANFTCDIRKLWELLDEIPWSEENKKPPARLEQTKSSSKQQLCSTAWHSTAQQWQCPLNSFNKSNIQIVDDIQWYAIRQRQAETKLFLCKVIFSVMAVHSSNSHTGCVKLLTVTAIDGEETNSLFPKCCQSNGACSVWQMMS